MFRALVQAAAPLRHIAIAIGVVFAVSVSGAFLVQAGEAPALVPRLTIAAGLGLAAGLPLGLAQSAVWTILVLLAQRLGLDTWWAQANQRDPGTSREPSVHLRAGLSAGVLTIAGFGMAVWLVVPRLLIIANQEFARSFGLVLLVVVVMAASVGGFVLARLLVPLFRRIDRRLALPWPPSPLLRYLLFVLAPVAAVLPWYLVTRANELGAFALPFWMLLLFAVEGFVALVWLRLRARATRERRPILEGIAAPLALIGAIAASVAMNGSPDAAGWAVHHPVLSPSASLMGVLTDLDRDGFSAGFGGGDCAGFDPSISPKARDIAGNGIDEDCSGQDTPLFDAEHIELYSGQYTPEADQEQPNIIFVIIDAVRSDTTGIGGADPSSTPYLDEAGEDSLVFTRAYSQSSATMISVPSMLAGRDPSKVRWQRGKRIEFTEDEQTLATRLEARGYNTMIIGEKYFKSHMSRIRDEYKKTRTVRYANKKAKAAPGGDYFIGISASSIIETIRYLEQSAKSKKPVFITAYIPDPHDRYERHGFDLGPAKKGQRALYEAEILNADRSLGFLIHYLKYMRTWNNTILVVVADHGEEFDEHGDKHHSRTCYIESVHVPLLMHIPGIEAQSIDTPVGLYDIAPTILEVLGETDTELELDGQSLLIPALAPERASPDRTLPCAVISQSAKQGNFFRRSARTGTKVLVHNVLEGNYELYDTVEDPTEQTNIYDANVDDPEVARLRAYLGETLTGTLPSTLLTD